MKNLTKIILWLLEKLLDTTWQSSLVTFGGPETSYLCKTLLLASYFISNTTFTTIYHGNY